MYEYSVNGMTCGSCVISIQKVIQKLDSSATVHVDLKQKIVHVKSSNGKEEIANSIEDAGYDVVNSRTLE